MAIFFFLFEKNNMSHKSKLIFCALSTFLPGSGLSWAYLKGVRHSGFHLHLAGLLIGIYGWNTLAQTEMSSTMGWIAVALGFTSLLASWITTLVYGLRPDEKWDAQFNPNSNQTNQSGWLVIGCVIISLMLGAFVLMSGLAIAFEQFFIAQIEEARKLSQ